MKKYFISNNLITENSIDNFNIVLNLFLGFVLALSLILAINGKVTFNYYTCIVLLIILIILYQISC